MGTKKNSQSQKGPACGSLPDGRVLDALYEIVLDRSSADPEISHTAKLFDKGLKKIAQKVGEEAVEAVIEGVEGDKAALTSESADLLYHLLVLWAARGVKPEEVWAALEGRKGISGIMEKANRAAETAKEDG